MNENVSESCDEGKMNELFADNGVKLAFDRLFDSITSKKEVDTI